MVVGTEDISRLDMDLNNNSKDTLGIHHGPEEELTAVVVVMDSKVGG